MEKERPSVEISGGPNYSSSNVGLAKLKLLHVQQPKVPETNILGGRIL